MTMAREEILEAMDKIAMCVNDEELYQDWELFGVADEDDYSEYTDDDSFQAVMNTFYRIMTRLKDRGGISFDGIYSC